jgi:hypothetical protein
VGDDGGLEEELPESEELVDGLSADFVSEDFASEDLLSPSAEAFISDRLDFEA